MILRLRRTLRHRLCPHHRSTSLIAGAPRRCSSAWCCGGSGGLYALGHAGVGLALALAGIRYRVSGRENVPAARPSSSARTTRATSTRRCCSRRCIRQLHVLYKAELRKFPLMGTVFDVGGFVPVDRARPRTVDAFARAGGRVAEGGQLVSDLPGRHPQPHRSAAAVQEGRLHHGDQGAGADRPGGDQSAAARRCGRGAPSSVRSK